MKKVSAILFSVFIGNSIAFHVTPPSRHNIRLFESSVEEDVVETTTAKEDLMEIAQSLKNTEVT